MKKCPSSIAIKEIQIKTTLRLYLAPVRIAVNKNTTNNKRWRRCGERVSLIHFCGNVS
jgi:hypothetical protein